MIEKVGIERVFVNPDVHQDETIKLVDLTMTLRDRTLFHNELEDMGYCRGRRIG